MWERTGGKRGRVGDRHTVSLPFQVEEPGHFQNFVPRCVGQIRLTRPDRYTLTIKPLRKKADAIMDLHPIRLVPLLE